MCFQPPEPRCASGNPNGAAVMARRHPGRARKRAYPLPRAGLTRAPALPIRLALLPLPPAPRCDLDTDLIGDDSVKCEFDRAGLAALTNNAMEFDWWVLGFDRAGGRVLAGLTGRAGGCSAGAVLRNWRCIGWRARFKINLFARASATLQRCRLQQDAPEPVRLGGHRRQAALLRC